MPRRNRHAGATSKRDDTSGGEYMLRYVESKMDLESPANACLLLRLSDSENYAVPFKWQDGRLGPPLKDVPIETGRRVNASMVFFRKVETRPCATRSALPRHVQIAQLSGAV